MDSKTPFKHKKRVLKHPSLKEINFDKIRQLWHPLYQMDYLHETS